jgi:hypothetical protein
LSAEDILALVRKRSALASEGAGREELRGMLRDAQLELTLRLGKMGRSSETMDAASLRRALNETRAMMRGLDVGLRDLVVDRATDAAEQSAADTHRYMKKMTSDVEGQPLPVREGEMVERAVEGSRAAVIGRLLGTRTEPGVIARYDDAAVGGVEEVLKRGYVLGMSNADVRSMLIESAPFLRGKPASLAERVLRTEVHGAYSRASWEATKAADDELGGNQLVRILCATFDSRTGSDSYFLHGMVRRLDEPFEWDGFFYMTPPNRPNDREVVVPHHVDWPISNHLRPRPYALGAARWRAEGRKGAPPRRPVMSTVQMRNRGEGQEDA